MSDDTDMEADVVNVRQIIQELVQEGLLEHAGEFRNGRPVHRITDLGRAELVRLKGRLQ